MCVWERAEATATAPDPATGNVLGILCSLTWAFTLIGFRWIERGQQGTALSAVVAGNVIAFAVGLAALVPLPSVSPMDWAALVYLGVFQIGLAYVLLTSAVGHLPTLHMSLLLLIEPVLNPLWAWLLNGEQPGALTLGGGAIIVGAAAAHAVYDARTAQRADNHVEGPTFRRPICFGRPICFTWPIYFRSALQSINLYCNASAT